MRIAYIDCFSGISGDMFLGALVDAGVSTELLERTVAALNIGATLEISRVARGGVSATKVDVIVGGQKDLPREVFQEQKIAARQHEHEHSHDSGHVHVHRHGDPPGRSPALRGHEHANEHRHGDEPAHGGSLREIRDVISRARISESAKARAIAIFEALGRAEAKIHNIDLETIHFHEVGSADAIVDIVCAAVGSEALGVDQWMCSPLNVGGGTVTCAHGTLPVPAPATVELLKQRNAPVFSTGVQKELVTPTGAAIVSVLADHFGSFPAMTVGRTGYGAGYRDLPGQANVLRLTIGEAVATSERPTPRKSGEGWGTPELPVETVSVLEATIDDMTPQMFGHFLDKALDAGALDAFVSLVQMKKNRPGMLLTVLTRPEDRDRIGRLVFAETTTIGLRVRDEQRYALPRKHVPVQTRWGEVRVKVAALDGLDATCTPEYEDCRRIAAEHGIPLKSVMQEVMRTYLQGSEQKNNG